MEKKRWERVKLNEPGRSVSRYGGVANLRHYGCQRDTCSDTCGQLQKHPAYIPTRLSIARLEPYGGGVSAGSRAVDTVNDTENHVRQWPLLDCTGGSDGIKAPSSERLTVSETPALRCISRDVIGVAHRRFAGQAG